MGLSIFLLILGAGLLTWGADRFVAASVAIAGNLRVPPLIIGVTLVGFATSLPEVLVSLIAALHGNAGLALGNALGSYITNIGLVLGVSALVAPLVVHSTLLRREFPMLVVALGLAWVLLADKHLGVFDGAVLILAFGVLIVLMTLLALRTQKRTQRADPVVQEMEAQADTAMSTLKAFLWLIIGLLVLVGSSRLLIIGASAIAKTLGVSDLMIGLTIVAVGTSLPELAASIVSVLRGEHDIALGNVLGSNMLGVLAVTAMPGLFAPGALPDMVLRRDFPVMGLLTGLLFIVSHGFKRESRITRLGGGLLFAIFVGYVVLLIYQA